MPTISRFFGIEIRMYYEDHGPAHFHAYYAEHAGVVSVETLAVLAGWLPKRVYSMVLEWAVEHRLELQENWRRAEAHQPLRWIEPLK